jgi:phage-related protein
VAPSLGKAEIQVVADLSKFPAELRAKLKAAFAEGIKGVDIDRPLTEEARKAGDHAAKEGGASFERTAKREFERVGRSAGRGFFSSLASVFRRGDRAAAGGFGGAIRNLFSSAENEISKGVQGLASAGSSIGSTLGGLFSGGGDITSIIKVTAITAAIPAVFALAGALVHLSGILLTLPALFGILASAIAPLIIGFQGFGAAIGAGFSGNAAQFKAALKGLAEPAQEVVKEIVGLRPILSAIKKDVQTALFAPLIGQFKALGTTFLPLVRAGFEDIADALGNLIGGFVGLLRQKDVLAGFQAIFRTTGAVIRGLTGPLLSLFRSLFVVMGAGAPFAQRLFKGLGDGIQRFSNFLNRAVADGRFQRFLENAFTIGRKLITIVGKVGELIGAIFGGQNVADSSAGFLDNITASLQHLIDFFKSDDGKKAIADFLKTVKSIGEVVEFLGSALAVTIRIFDQFASAIDTAVKAVASFFQAIGEGAAGAGSAVGDFFTKTIPSWFDSVVGFFEGLPGRILDALSSLGAMMRGLVADAVRGVVDEVATNIGRLIGFFLALPFLIFDAIKSIPSIFSAVFSFFANLGATVRGLVADVASSIGDAFLHGFEMAKGWVLSGISAISSFIHRLPDIITGIGPAMRNAAASIGRKIGEGLSQIGNFASDIGRKIVSTVRGGVNSIIDSINRGIADIDNKIPIGLPRLPHLERGGIVDSPTVALIGEKGKREVVLPLTDPARARELAVQSGLTKILGAQGGPPQVSLTAVLDGFGLIKVIDLRVDQALNDQGAELGHGART